MRSLSKHTQSIYLGGNYLVLPVFIWKMYSFYSLNMLRLSLLVFQGLPVYASKDLSDAQKAGIVTIEMGTGDMPLVRSLIWSHRTIFYVVYSRVTVHFLRTSQFIHSRSRVKLDSFRWSKSNELEPNWCLDRLSVRTACI